MKDWLYEKIARKNQRIQKEYERYVQGHLGEHRKKRWKHWLVLLALSWKYRDSQMNRIHTISLIKQKDDWAKIRMERIPGAVCYNLYVSQDGVHYRFLEKSSKPVHTIKGLKKEQIYFYKFKVTLDGSRYSDFSQVLTVSTAKNQELFFMERLTLAEEGSGSLQMKSAESKRISSLPSKTSIRGTPRPHGGAQLSWDSIPRALHYNLYRAEEGRPYAFLTQTAKNQYEDKQAAAGTQYSYKLKYTLDGKKYQEFPHILNLKIPGQPYENGNSGRLYEKGAESQASYRISPMHLAKSLMSYDVISFDVFDTLLFRPFSRPSDLFILLGQELDIMDFTEIRLNAEEEARRENQLLRGNREVTLKEIYRLVSQETGTEEEKAAALEFSLEKKLCYANPYMLEVFRLLKGQNKTLAAVSDMYLPGELVTELLAAQGYEGFDGVFVSCDYNCSKRDGGLFHVLKEKYKGKKIVHIGDNPKADIEEAKKNQIAARYYENVNTAGREFRAKDMSRLTGSAYQGIVNAWLHGGSRQYSPYYEVGFVYTGLYVMGFCQWLYRRVQDCHIDKILFLAREGDLYQKVFQVMHPEVSTEYVLWSRIAVAKTIVGKNRHPYLLQLVHHKANALYKSKVGTLFERIGIGALKKYLPQYRIKEEEFLTPSNEKVVRQLLIQHWQELEACYDKDGRYIRQYLTNKVGQAKRVAVVDVGWSGNNVLQVKYLLEKGWDMDCQAFCFLAAARNVNDTYMAGMMQQGQVETYIFSNMDNKGLHDAHQKENNKLNSFFFELLTQSCTPTFLGFSSKGEFLYDIPEVENYEHNRELHQGTLDFVREYKKRFGDFPYMLDISGHDAYMPFQYFSRNLLWLKKYFGDYIFGRDLFATQEKAVMESVEQVMKKANLWEET